MRSVVVAVAALVGLAACGDPSARTVAEDVIDALPDLTDEQRVCMEGKLDTYSDADLDLVAAGDPGPSNPTPEWEAFVDDLATCMDTGG